MPEVGDIALCRKQNDEFIEAELMAKSGNSFICMADTSEIFWSTNFRQLKTQQDIEREDAIDLMMETPISSRTIREQFAALYDAGYHNGVKVGDEVNEEDLLSIVTILSPKNTVNHLLNNFKIYTKR